MEHHTLSPRPGLRARLLWLLLGLCLLAAAGPAPGSAHTTGLARLRTPARAGQSGRRCPTGRRGRTRRLGRSCPRAPIRRHRAASHPPPPGEPIPPVPATVASIQPPPLAPAPAPTTIPPAAPAAPAVPTGTPLGTGYANPVSSAAAADPAVLDNGGAHDDYWAFTTGNRFPILRSPDLVHWRRAGLAMTSLPGWVVPTGDWHPWAPHVVQTTGPCPGLAAPGCYIMYYVGLSSRTAANCVAVATAPAPGGPYTDRGPLSNGTRDAQGRPVGCGDDAGYGQIDPSLFVDPATGRRYLYVSEDFACPPRSISCTAADSTLKPTISVIPLTADSLAASGPRIPLFSGDPGTWEAAGAGVPTVEGPAMVVHGGAYDLLYSGGSWRSRYAMGAATALGPLGPFHKATANPILASTASVVGPGGGDVPVTGPGGGEWLVYHGRDGSDANPRVLRIDPFSWAAQPDGSALPVIAGPTSTPQPSLP